jgi:hypothetical protein
MRDPLSLFCLHLDPEDGSSTFFCNVGELVPECTASRPTALRISSPFIMVKISIVWYVMSGSLLNVYRRFGGIYRLHPSGLGISQERNKREATTRHYIAEDRNLNHISFHYGVTRTQHLDPAQNHYNTFLILTSHFLTIFFNVATRPEFDTVWPVDRFVPYPEKFLFPGRAINKYISKLSLIWNPYINNENKITLLHEGTAAKINWGTLPHGR